MMKKLILISLILPSLLQAQVGYSEFKPLNMKSGKLTALPQLGIENVKFEDQDGNQSIDAQEQCYLSFTIKNTGVGDASGLRISVSEKNSVSGLHMESFVNQIRVLSSQKEQTVKVSLKGGYNLPNATALFKIEVSEANGFDPAPAEVKVSTQAFVPPNVLVSDYQFTTEKGGMPSKGQIISLRMIVQNTGQGEAKNVRLKIDLPINVLPISDDAFMIGTMQANESKVIDFQFAINNKYDLKDVFIAANLQEITGRYATGKKMMISLEQSLANQSSIEIKSVQNAAVQAITLASLRSDIDVNVPVGGVKREHAYALIIGNEDYSTYQRGLNSEVNVAFAKQDAQSFAEYAQKTLGIPADNITLITDGTSAKMRQSVALLSKLIAAEKGKAEVYVYYAGHGFPNEQTKESYLIPVDVSGTDVTDGLKLDELYAQLTEKPSKKVVVFLDACFSGGARNQSLLAARGVKIEPRKGALNGNIIVFSATSSDQSAMPYKDKQHGMFTYFLLKELQQAQGNIDLGTWLGNVSQNVTLNSLKVNQKDQTPQVQVSEELNDDWKKWTIR